MRRALPCFVVLLMAGCGRGGGAGTASFLEYESPKPGEYQAEEKKSKVAAEAPDPEILSAKGRRLFQTGQFAVAIDVLGQALRADPNHSESLELAARSCHSRAMQLVDDAQRSAANEYFILAAGHMRQLQRVAGQLDDELQEVFYRYLYNEACCYCVEGDTQQAIKSLHEAIDQGFADLQLLESDTDLAAARSQDSFQDVVSRLAASK